MYAVCDLVLGIILMKTTNFVLKDFPAEPVLPSKLFTQPDQVRTYHGYTSPNTYSLISCFPNRNTTIFRLSNANTIFQIKLKISKREFILLYSCPGHVAANYHTFSQILFVTCIIVNLQVLIIKVGILLYHVTRSI